MKILFIAPLPPPITGHSIASVEFLNSITAYADVNVVNFSKKEFAGGVNNLGRFWDIGLVLKEVFQKKRNVDIVYLTISESMAGNLKDLLTFIICYRKLSKTYIHLHGGSIGKLLYNKYGILKKINKFFIRKLAGVIVLGRTQEDIFKNMIDSSRIHIVPNFAGKDFFATDAEIYDKYFSIQPLRILFLSNLIKDKGYIELLEAVKLIDKNTRSSIRIDFAGLFETEQDLVAFTKEISKFPEIQYHGMVQGHEKKALLLNAHVFCLPTGFNEGQPISILEAYAAGCVVLTTLMGGIPDIFEDEINGFAIPSKTPQAVKQGIEKCIDNKDSLCQIGLRNGRMAREQYRPEIFNRTLQQVIGIKY